MLHLSTKDFAGSSKVTRWNDIVAEVFTPLETKPFSPEEFEGAVDSVQLGDIFLANVKASPDVVTRTANHAASSRVSHRSKQALAPTHGPRPTPQMLKCLTHRHQRVVTRSSSTGTGNGSNSAWHCIVGCGGCGRNRRHEQASAAMTRQGKNPATAAAWMPQRAETGECVRPDRY